MAPPDSGLLARRDLTPERAGGMKSGNFLI